MGVPLLGSGHFCEQNEILNVQKHLNFSNAVFLLRVKFIYQYFHYILAKAKPISTSFVDLRSVNFSALNEILNMSPQPLLTALTSLKRLSMCVHYFLCNLVNCCSIQVVISYWKIQRECVTNEILYWAWQSRNFVRKLLYW